MTERIEFVLPLPADGEYLLATSWQYVFHLREAGKRYRRDGGAKLFASGGWELENLSGRLAIKIIAGHRISAVVIWTISRKLDALDACRTTHRRRAFGEINIVRSQLVSGGRLGVKIYEIMHDGRVKKETGRFTEILFPKIGPD